MIEPIFFIFLTLREGEGDGDGLLASEGKVPRQLFQSSVSVFIMFSNDWKNEMKSFQALETGVFEEGGG